MIVAIKTKICTKCGIEHPATMEFFTRCKGGKHGLYSKCKMCCRKREQSYRGEHSEYYRQYRGGHKEQRRQWLQLYNDTLRGRLRIIFSGIRQRCTNPNLKQYKDYGGRGIQNKFTSFDNFFNCVVNGLGITGVGQIKGLEIDRIDNNGHYESDNIRFVTPKENCNNRRK